MYVTMLMCCIFLYYYLFYFQSVCPLHMQSLAVIDKVFSLPPSGLKFYGDIGLYQAANLLCISNVIDTKYNNSLLNYRDNNELVDSILKTYFHREGKFLLVIY